MKKEEVASKMRKEKCTICGRGHNKSMHSGKGYNNKESRSAARNTIESDHNRIADQTEDKFSGKEQKKEKTERKDKVSLGKGNAKAWEI